MVKLATRALVYVHVPTKTPLFFDSDGRNHLFPTVYALWRVREIIAAAAAAAATTAAAAPESGSSPDHAAASGMVGAGGSGGGAYCCPPLVVHPPVSKFVLNGADVMLPGVYTAYIPRETATVVCRDCRGGKMQLKPRMVENRRLSCA